jgi:hypothetical protein
MKKTDAVMPRSYLGHEAGGIEEHYSTCTALFRRSGLVGFPDWAKQETVLRAWNKKSERWLPVTGIFWRGKRRALAQAEDDAGSRDLKSFAAVTSGTGKSGEDCGLFRLRGHADMPRRSGSSSLRSHLFKFPANSGSKKIRPQLRS